MSNRDGDRARPGGYRVGIWKADPTHSTITFSVRHVAISRIRGSFRRFEVTVVAPADPAALTVDTTIDVASIDTKVKDRDERIRSSRFIDVVGHPTWTFRSTAVTIDGDRFTLAGDLTIRGVTRPVTMKGELGGVATDASGRATARFTAATKVSRRDFGMTVGPALEAALALGDEVTIALELQLVQQG